ncbi:MAG TPA: prephenate dehydratase [Thermoanaerobaculia bacterium]|nr:prephenate dehydratase [Thermoanaerobaculia bacterium]
MNTITTAFQGERGAFSEKAATRLLGHDVALLPCRSFEEMFASVGEGAADCCVAPIENSLAGSIHRNYDLLLASQLTVAGETNLRIVHNLIARGGATLEGIRRVYSHPVALAQCGRFLRDLRGVEAVPVHDTAGAVRLVLERDSDEEAAIASAEAATLYGGNVLAPGIEDHAQNFTRFLLLTHASRSLPVQEPARRWKTSLVFRVPNQPGSLHRALGAFAMFDIDLAKIESRPVEGRPWEYAFYLDLIGRRDEPHIARALENLTAMAETVQVLGSYPTKW